MWGLTVDEASGAPVEIWPDNEIVVDVFTAMDTQWRTGMGGATGLDLLALPIVVPEAMARPDWPVVLAGLRVMERAALKKMHQKT